MRMIEVSASPSFSPPLKTSRCSSSSVILFHGQSLGSSNLNAKTLRGVQRARLQCSSRPGPGSAQIMQSYIGVDIRCLTGVPALALGTISSLSNDQAFGSAQVIYVHANQWKYTFDLSLILALNNICAFPRLTEEIDLSATLALGLGESDSKAILDAFFLGKALAEAVNDRIGSTVGEFLSVIGQWQAEQQKQVLDFQDDVLERARKAKEKAAREAKEEQGVTPYAITTSADAATPAVSPPSSGPVNGDYEA